MTPYSPLPVHGLELGDDGFPHGYDAGARAHERHATPSSIEVTPPEALEVAL